MRELPVNSWADFKNLVSTKSLKPQYYETSTTWEIFAKESEGFIWIIALLKNTADATDFEDNHKANYNKPIDIQETGGVKEPNGMRARLIGLTNTNISFGQTVNIDWLIPQLSWAGSNKQIYFDGVQYYAKNATVGDNVTFQVIDKDGIGVTLGWYSQAQFDAMGNLYVAEEFATNWFISPDKLETILLYRAKMISGLYLRIIYASTGLTTVQFACNLYRHLHERENI